jgi:ComF family protein
VFLGTHCRLAVAAFEYSGPIRRALAALKYTGVRRLAPLVADITSPVLEQLLPVAGDEPSLVPVPVHAERLAARGYNQAELLATALAASCGLRSVRAIERTGRTKRQHGLGRAARIANLRGAFVAAAYPARSAILVDDIITTGATLEVCASVLLSAGCEEVFAVAVAREV